MSLFVTGRQDDRDLSKLETLVWDPNNTLQDQHIDQFLVIARYLPNRKKVFTFHGKCL